MLISEFVYPIDFDRFLLDLLNCRYSFHWEVRIKQLIVTLFNYMIHCICSQTCLKRSLKRRQKKRFSRLIIT